MYGICLNVSLFFMPIAPNRNKKQRNNTINAINSFFSIRSPITLELRLRYSRVCFSFQAISKYTPNFLAHTHTH